MKVAFKAKERMQENYTTYNRKAYCKALSDIKDLIMKELSTSSLYPKK